MGAIDSSTSLLEIASLVSQALEAAGIAAVLSGGAAVTIYSDNKYESVDLDFITSARNTAIAKALEPLGFFHASGRKDLVHPNTEYCVEFPPGPLAFGDSLASESDATVAETPFGPLRIVTPTQSVMDRLAHYVAWKDNQTFDQAAMVASRHEIDWAEVERWVEREGAAPSLVERLRDRAARLR
jgi:hypothetical protein